MSLHVSLDKSPSLRADFPPLPKLRLDIGLDCFAVISFFHVMLPSAKELLPELQHPLGHRLWAHSLVAYGREPTCY